MTQGTGMELQRVATIGDKGCGAQWVPRVIKLLSFRVSHVVVEAQGMQKHLSRSPGFVLWEFTALG